MASSNGNFLICPVLVVADLYAPKPNPLFQFLIHKELIEQKSTGRKAENEILDIGDSLGTKMVNLFLSHTDVSLITL